MKIYVVRHGEAEGMVTTDAARALTAAGRHQVRGIWQQLRQRGVAPQWLVSSPYVRARETSALVAEGFPALEPLLFDGLTPDGDPLAVIDWLAQQPLAGDGVLVSHMPLVSLLVAELSSAGHVTFPVACVACLDMEILASQGGRLLWMESGC